MFLLREDTEMNMLEDLVDLLCRNRGSEHDPLEEAASFLRRYEGKKVQKVHPQYIRIRVQDLESVGCTRSIMAKTLDISERYVYQILKKNNQTVQ